MMLHLSLGFVFLAFIEGQAFSTDNAPDIVYEDEGNNVTLACPTSTGLRSGAIWIVSDTMAKQKLGSQNSVVQDNGSLLITDLTSTDSHIYTCQDAETNQSLGSIKLSVRTMPPAVNNLTVLTRSVYALVTWELHGNGGYPVERFSLAYRQDESKSNKSSSVVSWNVIDDVRPNATSITVYQLVPNATYYFRLQAVNRLGASHEVTVSANTKYDPDEIRQAKELVTRDQESSSSVYMKVTIVAICMVLVTFAVLALGISLLTFRNCGKNVHTELNNCEATEDEVMELVPHITLNPSFNIDMLEYIEAENSPTDACERTSLVQSYNDSSRGGPNG